jgi:hypothetical protein
MCLHPLGPSGIIRIRAPEEIIHEGLGHPSAAPLSVGKD